MTTNVIATFHDDESNLDVQVVKIDTGYSVSILDIDSGEILPSILIFNDEVHAVEKAKRISQGKA